MTDLPICAKLRTKNFGFAADRALRANAEVSADIIDALYAALEGVESEIMLDGQLAEIVQAALERARAA